MILHASYLLTDMRIWDQLLFPMQYEIGDLIDKGETEGWICLEQMVDMHFELESDNYAD